MSIDHRLDDAERRLATLVSEQADLRLGPRRPPPAFSESPSSGRSQVSRRVLLAAASCLLVVCLGLSWLVFSSRDRRIPAGPVVPQLQQVEDARIALPSGWEVRPKSAYEGFDNQPDRAFCLTPDDRPDAQTWADCPLWLIPYAPDDAITADTVGQYTDFFPCAALFVREIPLPQVEGGTRRFGGREAEWRRWSFPCATGTERYEQLLVPGEPRWTIFARDPSEETSRTLAMVLADSELPAQTGALRRIDTGVITAMTTTPSGQRITLDRSYGWESVRRRTGVAVTYDVPADVVATGRFSGAIAVGTAVTLETDGITPTAITPAS